MRGRADAMRVSIRPQPRTRRSLPTWRSARYSLSASDRMRHAHKSLKSEDLLVGAHAASYYAASAPPAPLRAALAGSAECDVCVVGGGIAGCSAALHLAERGYSVVLLEQHRIGWGASGRSGAQAIHGVASGQSKLERLIGGSAARAVWEVSIEGLALMRSLIARYRIDCDWVDGTLLTAVKPRHDRELRQELEELQERLHYRSVRYMPREEVWATLATQRYLG